MHRLIRVLFVLALLASACAGGEGGDVASSGDAASGSVGPEAAAVVPEAPAAVGPAASVEVAEALQFSATTLSGAAFEGGDFAGQDLMLWFWAPW